MQRFFKVECICDQVAYFIVFLPGPDAHPLAIGDVMKYSDLINISLTLPDQVPRYTFLDVYFYIRREREDTVYSLFGTCWNKATCVVAPSKPIQNYLQSFTLYAEQKYRRMYIGVEMRQVRLLADSIATFMGKTPAELTVSLC